MSTVLDPTVTVEPTESPAAPSGRPVEKVRPPTWNRGRLIAAVAAALWLLTGVYIIGPDQQAVVTRFGEIVERRVLPGIHLTWPYPIAEVHKLKVLQRQRAFIGGAPADQPLGQVEPLASQFLTGDQNLINIRTVVQYSVATPDEYLFRAEDVGQAISAATEAELSRQISLRNVDDVLTTEKVAIQETVRLQAQQLVDQYGLGVVLSTVSIEYIAPPAETAASFLGCGQRPRGFGPHHQRSAGLCQRPDSPALEVKRPSCSKSLWPTGSAALTRRRATLLDSPNSRRNTTGTRRSLAAAFTSRPWRRFCRA